MLQTLYFTTADRDAAVRLARRLVQERLVACANIVDSVTSVYQWEGKVHEDPEMIVFAKTTSELSQHAIERVQELHEYECPCVVSWEIDAASSAYQEWVESETRSRSE